MVHFKHVFVLSLISFGLLLSGCRSDLVTATGKILSAGAMASQTETQSAPEIEMPPIPIPDDFERFEDVAHGISLSYPQEWTTETDIDDEMYIFVFTPHPEQLGSRIDPDEPLAFFLGAVRILEAAESDAAPLTIQADTLGDLDLELTSLSDLSTATEGQQIQISQRFSALDPGGAPLEMTITTLIHGRRTVSYLYGGNPLGLPEHAAALDVMAASLELAPFPPPRAITSVGPTEVDFGDPAAVLQAVFDSAITADYAVLPSLCDPLGENDDDTQAICDIETGHELEDLFYEYFSLGQITGVPEIDGDEAEVPFTFGPDGTDEETMDFILRDGKWYLYGF